MKKINLNRHILNIHLWDGLSCMYTLQKWNVYKKFQTIIFDQTFIRIDPLGS
jgi:hypothetical protein